MISEEEIEEFFNKPNFEIDTTLTCNSDHPDWVACMNDFKLLLSDLCARDTIYQQCKKRYFLLYSKHTELMKISELKNSLCIVLAEALFWLSDLSGSLSFYYNWISTSLNLILS